MPAYSTDKGFTGSGSAYGSKDKAKASGQASGSRVVTENLTQPRDPAGPNGSISGGAAAGPGVKSYKGTGTSSDSSKANAPKQNMPFGVSDQYTPGAVGYYSDPSVGQVIGTVAPALVPGGGLLNNAPSLSKGKFDTQNKGGLLGEGIDSLTGQKPGLQTGWSEDPSMSSTRGRSQRGTKRESFEQTASGAVGGATDDPTQKAAPLPTEEFSDIALADRRKPGLKQMLETML
ncbi:hypothetical protein [Dongia sp.]|uniref:hypothetical protein n=1 Tax=Dongia sp. TaxID=1977262 RepID=UPI0037512252